MPIRASYHNRIVGALRELGRGVAGSGMTAMPRTRAKKAERLPFAVWFTLGMQGGSPEVRLHVKSGVWHGNGLGPATGAEGSDTWVIEDYDEPLGETGEIAVVLKAPTDDYGIVTGMPAIEVETGGGGDSSSGDDEEEEESSAKVVLATANVKLDSDEDSGTSSLDAEVTQLIFGDYWHIHEKPAEDIGDLDMREEAFKVWFTVGATDDDGSEEDGGESNDEGSEEGGGKSGTITMHVGPGHIQGIGVQQRFPAEPTSEEDLPDGYYSWQQYRGKVPVTNDGVESTVQQCYAWVQSTPKGGVSTSTIRVEGTKKKISAGGEYYVVLKVSRAADGFIIKGEVEIASTASGSENWNPQEDFEVLIGTYTDIKVDEYGRVTYTSVRGLYGDYWYYPQPMQRFKCLCLCGGTRGLSLRPLEYLGSPYAWTRTNSNEWTLANVIVYGALNYATAGWQTLAARAHLYTCAGANGVVQGIEASANSGTTLCREKGNVLFSRLHDLAGVMVSVSNSSVPALVYLTITGTENGMSGQWGILTDLSNGKDKLPWNPQAFVQTFHACMSAPEYSSYFDFRSCARAEASDFYKWTVTIPMALITSSAAGRNVLIPLHQGFVEARPTLYFASGAAEKSSEMSPSFSSPSASGSPSPSYGDPIPYIPNGVITDDTGVTASPSPAQIDEADAAA